MKQVLKLLSVVMGMCLLVSLFSACGKIDATGMSLDKTLISIEVDSGAQLTPIFVPENASNKSVSWASDKPDVASVSATGWVEAKSEGTALISATSTDGNFRATCSVTVVPTSGKTRAQVKAAYQFYGYSETYTFVLENVFLPTYTYEKVNERAVIIFCTNASIATTVKPVFDEKAQANGLVCKQEGRILYYGTSSAVAVFETI